MGTSTGARSAVSKFKNMSGRIQKKLKQMYRREIRGSFNVWAETVRDKPWWLPNFVWATILKMVFRPDAAQIMQRMKKEI